MSLKPLLFRTDGRIGKKTFWTGVAILAFAVTALDFIPLLGNLLQLTLIYSWICVLSKRLHDANMSGRLAGLFAAIVAVTSIASFVILLIYADPPNPETLQRAGYITGRTLTPLWIAGLFILLFTGFRAGTLGDNKYGASPIATNAQPPAGPA